MNSKLPPLVETNGNSIIMNLENVRPYLLFDDGFGENQDNNMVSPDLIKIIEELSGDLVSGDRSNVEENGKGSALKVDHSQSQIEIAPLGGLLTDLGQFDLFLENIDPQVRNGFVDPFQGAPLKYPNLFSLLERRVGEASEKRRLRQLVVESQPKQSKWVFIFSSIATPLLTLNFTTPQLYCSTIQIDMAKPNCTMPSKRFYFN